MQRATIVVAIAFLVGCGATPFDARRGTPSTKDVSVGVSISASGFRFTLAAKCEATFVERWCDPNDRACTTKPTVTKTEVECPQDLSLRGVPISLRAPWGAVYHGSSDDSGSLDVAIEWAKSGIDPLADGVAEQLATNWILSTDDGRVLDLKISPADVEAMRTTIGEATDTQYEAGSPTDRALLKAELVEQTPLETGGVGTIGLAITNSGAKPAYRVIAKLKSGAAALDGIQLSFGRIDPGKTKVRTRRISIPANLDDRAPLVLGTIAASNADEFSVQRRYNVGVHQAGSQPQPALGLECKLITAEVAPRERVRIQCTLRNARKSPASELRVQVAVADTKTANLGPKQLAPGETVTLEFVGETTSAKQGATLPVLVTVSGTDVPAVTQSLSVRIASLAITCKGEKLTRAEYDTKKKRLQAALAAGVLTQQEFDQYEAGLVSCLK